MSDYDFIRGFQNIKLSSICKKYKIAQSNITSGCTSDENLRKVKGEILKELLMLFIADRKEDLITLSLYDEILKKIEKENRMLREMI